MRFTRPEIGPTSSVKQKSSGFCGETCPICGENRLGATLEYPVCNRCRHKYHITHDFLRELKTHRLLISEEIIDWQQKPHPAIKGAIDDEIPWKASFVMGGWLVEVPDGAENRIILAQLIKQYLDSVTPAWLERVKSKKTAIRRYFFMAAAGATMVTVVYVLAKRAERQKKEIQEAEEAEKRKKG